MIKQKVYLDTTVPSAYFDDRAPDRQKLTRDFWNERLLNFTPVISTIVEIEIKDTPDLEKRDNMQTLVKEFDVLKPNDESDELAQEYVDRKIFTEKFAADANHVAIAVVNGINFLASWNFRHLVKVNTRREVNLINALMGYGQIEIIAPPEL
jgi:predicted nucleic acid-binding protein